MENLIKLIYKSNKKLEFFFLFSFYKKKHNQTVSEIGPLLGQFRCTFLGFYPISVFVYISHNSVYQHLYQLFHLYLASKYRCFASSLCFCILGLYINIYFCIQWYTTSFRHYGTCNLTF